LIARKLSSRDYEGASLAGQEAPGMVDDQVDGRSVVAALCPGPLPTLGIDGLSGSNLTEQLVRAALLQQRQ
jgi:hypothetical protein